jgi:hypothetical protein
MKVTPESRANLDIYVLYVLKLNPVLELDY